jgi:hypothetical protein
VKLSFGFVGQIFVGFSTVGSACTVCETFFEFSSNLPPKLLIINDCKEMKTTNGIHQTLNFDPGRPDFPWYNIPKWGK